jgi:hypothetical protein
MDKIHAIEQMVKVGIKFDVFVVVDNIDKRIGFFIENDGIHAPFIRRFKRKFEASVMHHTGIQNPVVASIDG